MFYQTHRAHVFAWCFVVFNCLAPSSGSSQERPLPQMEKDFDAAALEQIIDDLLSGHRPYERLVELCDGFGHRLSGSAALESAIDWAVDTLKAQGHENVGREPVEIQRWVRGIESIQLLEPRIAPVAMLGLGNSMGTPPEGITAEVLTVRTKEELEALGERVRGKIILFNNAMPQWTEEKGTCYGATVQFRLHGARVASGMGALGVFVRSVTAHSLRSPHTGSLVYGDAEVQIPAAAVSTEDADLIQRYQDRGRKVVVHFKMSAHFGKPVLSGNVVAEIRGSEIPEEIVVIGGHIDSWDVGQGAHDDGAGVVMAMETLNTIRRLGLKPRRTIRVVLWTNEENGMGGSKAYLAQHMDELPLHAAAIEADFGGFAPHEFGVALKDKKAEARAVEKLKLFMPALERTGKIGIKAGSSAPDVYRLGEYGVPVLGLYTNSEHYFDYHHTEADTVDKVDPDELSHSAAALAGLTWILANMKGRLGDKSE